MSTSPTGPRVGLLLPTFASLQRHPGAPAALVEAATSAEALGFTSLWVIDHLLPAPTYGQSWLEPLISLAWLAGRVPRLRLGTAVLVAPLRHPVLLAKEAASLQLLSGGRLILGLGAGWNPAEFGALGVPRSERGSRTDEILDALRALLGRPEASFAGDHFRFDDVVLEPRPDPPIPLWIGGGTQPPMRGASERHPRAPERVIRRIAGADGWCAPPHAGAEQLAGDWERIQGAARSMGRDPGRITFAQQGYVHLVDTASRDRALEEQRRAFERYLGPARPWSFARANYLVGTFDDVIERLRQRAATGVEELVLGPVTGDAREIRRQLELLSTRVVPELG